MKWLSFLSRPAHESADPKKRAHAIAHDASAELIQRLPDFARHDRDATVRMNALRRIDDLSLLADRARLDGSAEVRALAQSRLRHFLLDTATAMVQRQRQVRVLDDPALLEEVARQAPETDLRRAALERIQRPGLIFERCLKDPDPVLRAELLNRIEEPAQLERLAEAARKTDKQLARLARERLTAIQLQRGDANTIRERAEALCLELSAGLRPGGDTSAQRLELIETEWSALKPTPDPPLCTRFQGLLTTLRHVHDAAQRPRPSAIANSGQDPTRVIEPTASTSAVNAEPAPKVGTATGALDPEHTSAEAVDQAPLESVHVDPEQASVALQTITETLGDASDASAEQIAAVLTARRKALTGIKQNAANNALDQHIGDWLDAAQTRQNARMAKRTAQQEALRQCLMVYADAVSSGQLRLAREQRRQAHRLAASLDADGTGKAGRLPQVAAIDQDFEKLARWQHWANEAQRKQLCEQIHTCIGTGEHPDALLNRVKTAQAEWQHLNESERDPSQAAAPETALDKRFRMLCDQAMQPARPYLEKRSELRLRKHNELQAFVDGIEQTLATDPSATSAAGLRRQLIERWRELDELNGRERKQLGERLRRTKEALDLRLQAQHDGAVADKQKFIAQTRRQVLAASGAEALAAAKTAMTKWKTLARSDRKTDDALWIEFRGLVDPVFAQSQADQQASAASAASERQAIAEILQSLRELRTGDVDLARLDSTLGALKTRWQILTGKNRDDERAYDQDLAALVLLRLKLQSASQQATRQRVLNLHLRLLALHQLSDATSMAESRAEIQIAIAETALPGAEQKALSTHLASFDNPLDADPATLARLERLAVLAEIFAAMESPPASASLRKQLQMERLANRLGGSGQAPEANALWLDWLALGGIAESERRPLDARLTLAFGALFDRTIAG